MMHHNFSSCTILRAVVGSTLHGVNNKDGLEDRDEMGVIIEPYDWALTVKEPFEQYVYRSAEERTGKSDAPSEAGDLDLTLYSLRKYLRLALNGNPTILLLLFAPESACVHIDARGRHLQELTPSILSKRSGKAFLGYLHAQRQRMLGERGNAGHGRPRSMLIEQYGFDTKYAMHMCRLGLQGIELLTTGQIQLPIEESERLTLLDIRNGKWTMQQVLTFAGELESQLKDLVSTCDFPDEPEVAKVDAWMRRMYYTNWSATQWHLDRLEADRIHNTFHP